VGYERRARVMALTETSWAGGMLLGVPILGLVAALTSWRMAYGAGAAFCALLALAIALGLPSAAPGGHGRTGAAPAPSLDRTAYSVIATMALLMGAAQFMFVVFGSWLEDRFDFGTVAIGAASVLLGVAELSASLSAVRFTDRLGKRRAVLIGAATMAPAAVALALCEQWLVPGLALLALFVVGFEFAIVSVFPISSELRPAARARTMGLGLSAGTGARGLAAIPATWLYSHHGLTPTALVAAALAALILPILGWGARSVR
jgi:predicted MFS family arabinose efflux permease